MFEVSVGVAHSKSVAKWASLAAKPPRPPGSDACHVALRSEALAALLARSVPLSRYEQLRDGYVTVTERHSSLAERPVESIAMRRNTT